MVLLLAEGKEAASSLCPGAEDKGHPAPVAEMHGDTVTGQEGSEELQHRYMNIPLQSGGDMNPARAITKGIISSISLHLSLSEVTIVPCRPPAPTQCLNRIKPF